MAPSNILGPRGRIAKHWSSFESRPEQLAMSDAVADAIRNKHHLMVEAGTGVGKSFAYLVPAIEAALADRNCRVVISTHTIGLQEQLLKKDIPFLQDIFPQEFKAVLVKGRSNYLSLRRLRVAQQRVNTLLAESGAVDQLIQIGRWSRSSLEGSRADLPFQPIPTVWGLVESDSGNCLGRNCPDHSNCFYFQARRAMSGAQLLIVNHALFFSDLALRRSGAQLLPDYQVAIFDEAHTLEDVAADHLGLQINQGTLEYLLNQLLTPRQNKGLLMAHGTPEIYLLFEETRRTAEKFFLSLQQWQIAQGRSGTGRVRESNIVPDILSPLLQQLANLLVDRAQTIASEEEKIEVLAVANRCEQQSTAIHAWLEQSLKDQVYWVEGRGEKQMRVGLASAPIDVGPALKAQLYDKVPTVILTSATLSTADGPEGFTHAQRRLGMTDCETLQLGSPFDYATQAELHLFRNDMPDPTASAAWFEDAVIEKIPEYVERSQGRAFVLFTSYTFLSRAAERLRDWFRAQRYTLLCQGEGLPPNKLVEQFRTQPRAVLFGVDSFWQGVDVKGEALTNVMITKLPFAVPDRPVTEARMERIQERGGVPFRDFQVPMAVIKLKQGFGRLIRTQTDRGMVVLFDPRVLTKPYGRVFLDALPPAKRFIDGKAQ
ncbi:ATP-dependent DNA helicase [Tuwongella immobilis]|uniref:DNA 5'-3' helicase n=1 Tax=Tuwongella immobilis TaxID=692036 RepID=A0A6C2YI35_9BACT|nr:helicase C-terminal domain-containing protein [Tuwongella immobilis]VIP01087.1 helicase c2 : DNA helicase, Rad3 OS=Singulisphaera acidiphila (strain ATCC BAA-1392 / DSM 18658 / VKM B-2454 / MOB10) GN=Sinac_5251 PE=4 SV=1: DEAD: DEAD_2: Helicase_C_2 [Tuwongella immobilis]VTR97599.1 helicase c2 : DNA helicase, Rad3 OS=Singulisphaera acidiphila (strain ATCC BAA-1392 / DSM 18658 / VKM B-2454 / MOB10) GN=Sinac_5251 PE=4 SV=1: DEAD: DEAD_2: Helicase_C_2 [Tuwongella immobilis]